MERCLKRLIRCLPINFIKDISKAKDNENLSTSADFLKCFNKTEGMLNLEEATLLYHLAKNVTDHCIIEVGSYRGRSTTALGLGSVDGSQVPVFAIEPHENFVGVFGGQFGPEDRGAFYRAMLKTSCYKIVRLVNLSSEIVAPLWNRKVSLLWIDGDHSYNGVKKDFECWSPHLVFGGLAAFHDSKDPAIGPFRLINELVANGNYDKIHEVGAITVLKQKISTDSSLRKNSQQI